MTKLRQSGDDYLETILILSPKGEVCSIDIANEMNVSKPEGYEFENNAADIEIDGNKSEEEIGSTDKMYESADQ